MQQKELRSRTYILHKFQFRCFTPLRSYIYPALQFFFKILIFKNRLRFRKQLRQKSDTVCNNEHPPPPNKKWFNVLTLYHIIV